MFKIPETKERLSTFFYYLAACYDDKRFPDFCGVYQFALCEGPTTFYYYISVAGGQSEVCEGQHPSPAVTFYASVLDWFRLCNGSVNSVWAFLTRRFRVRGSLSHLAQMKNVFGKRFDRFDIPDMGRAFENFELPNKRIWKKPKKVLVINGSPRRQDGFTYFYLRHLLEGIQDAGCAIELIHLCDEDIKIESCRGCFHCEKQSPGVCMLNDDAAALLEKIEQSYLTIYAFPLYACWLPDKLQALLNRHFVLVGPYGVPFGPFTRHPKRNKRERYAAIFAISGMPQLEQFKRMMKVLTLGHAIYVHVPFVAVLFRPAAEELARNPSCGEPLQNVLKALRVAGKELMEQGKVAGKILKVISKTYIPLLAWHRGFNMSRYLEQKQISKTNSCPKE